MQLSRRTILTVPVLVALGAVAACEDQPPVTSASPTASPTPGQTASTTITNIELTLNVGPLIRVDQTTTVLPLRVTGDSTASGADQLRPGRLLVGDAVSDLANCRPLRLIDTAGGRLWSTTSTRTEFPTLAESGEQDLHATFGAVDVDTVTVFLSRTAFVEVPVVNEAPDIDIDLTAVVEDSAPNTALAEPVVLERYTEAIDGSSSSLTTEESTTVDVASDVTFDVDSAELNAGAETALTGISQTISQYEGGSLSITGHTDDIADDAYNQDLSQRRAQAVADRLGALTDLSAWEVTVSGKGESEPRVPNDSDEARQVNRRVEIVITPTGGTNGEIGRSGSQAALPDSTGPTATGVKGVTVDAPQTGLGQIQVSLAEVKRRGTLLLGELTVTGGTGGSFTPLGTGWLDDPGSVLANARGELGGATTVFAANGLTLLAGSDRVFPVDYLLPGTSAHRALTELELIEPLSQDEKATVLVVWPDTGETTLILDHDAGGLLSYPFRLTDIPVVT